MTDRFEAILDESITAMQAGVPIEEILGEVPEYATQLRPLLYASALLTDPNPALVPEEKKATLRSEYLRQVAELPQRPAPTLANKAQAIVRIVKKRITRKAVLNDLVTISVTIILTVSMAVLILNYAAADTLPGDFLYGIKRTSENLRLAFTVDETSRQALVNEFNRRRLAEIDRLMAVNRAAVVEFQGVLETKGENLWVIEGHTIYLPDDLVVEGNPQEGDMIEVIGLIGTNKLLVADKINVLK